MGKFLGHKLGPSWLSARKRRIFLLLKTSLPYGSAVQCKRSVRQMAHSCIESKSIVYSSSFSHRKEKGESSRIESKSEPSPHHSCIESKSYPTPHHCPLESKSKSTRHHFVKAKANLSTRHHSCIESKSKSTSFLQSKSKSSSRHSSIESKSKSRPPHHSHHKNYEEDGSCFCMYAFESFASLS